MERQGEEGELAVPREVEELWAVLRQRGRLQEEEQEQEQLKQLRFALAVGRRLHGSDERETHTHKSNKGTQRA